MGKELIYASGKEHGDIAFWWIVEVISAIACVLILYWAANKFGYVKTIDHPYGFMVKITTTSLIKNDFYNISIAIGVICGILCLICGYLCQSRISRTYISICEKGVEGIGVVPKFPLSFMFYGAISSLQLSEFRLKYEEVSSVDIINRNALIIHTVNADHKIYAINAREVRNALLEQKELENVSTKENG
ncbi:hypothetical protein AGMMS49938_17890 [Fibrobacterales bacterium]|nr:hypothetical protein AGMMS49938_17890 [Fibrobacterales bacterium]